MAECTSSSPAGTPASHLCPVGWKLLPVSEETRAEPPHGPSLIAAQGSCEGGHHFCRADLRSVHLFLPGKA